MTSRACLLLTPSLLASLALAAIACSSAEGRPTFEPPLDAGRDSTAALPTDAGGETDARASLDFTDRPVTCSVEPCVVELAAGASHVCARMSDGTARCWGEGAMGELGGGRDPDDVDPGPGPVAVVGLANVTQISAAGRSTCARLGDGAVRCWGANEHAQLGLAIDPPLADDVPHPSPERADVTGSVARVDLGPRSACARLDSGDVWCWGANDRLQLGRTGTDPVAGPGLLPAASVDAARFALTWNSSFALTRAGALVGWGAVSGREGSLDPDPSPFALSSLRDVVGLAAGTDHACVLADAAVRCWGRNRSGALCTGLPDDERLPVRVSTAGAAYPQRLAASARNTCVRMSSGAVQCCGDDSTGQLGLGEVTSGSRTFVVAKAFAHHAVQVVVTDRATCALVDDGSVECWGDNGHGELGQGTKNDGLRLAPVRVAF